MLGQPSFELLPSPAFRKVGSKDRYRVPERGSPEQPGIVVPSLMPVGPVDFAPELISQVSEGKWIAGVQFDLQIWLLSIGRE